MLPRALTTPDLNRHRAMVPAEMPLTSTTPRIAYDVHGTSGPPVLLIMGFGMRGRVWRLQVEALRATHRVAVFDNRGIGESEGAPGPWRMHDLARDALRVLDALGWSSAHVVGASMGGMIAQEVALHAPDRLRSLGLLVTHAGGPRARPPLTRTLRSLVGSRLLPPDRRLHPIGHLLYPRRFVRSTDREALAARMAEQTGGRVPPLTWRKQFGAIARHDTRARLPRVTAPTLVVSAARDALVDPRESEKLAGYLPRAELLRFEEAGHGILYQCADALNRRLLSHIARHDGRALAGAAGKVGSSA